MTDISWDRNKFHLPLQVRYADTDAQGHVFFANYLTYCDEGFLAYLREIGYSWDKMLSMGVELYYAQARCDFKAPTFFEELLHVHTYIARVGDTSLTAESAIYRAKSDELVATGEITAVMVIKGTGKPTPIPDKLRHAVCSYQDS